MKKILLSVLTALIAHVACAQTDGPKELTPQLLQKLKADIEQQIPVLKKTLSKDMTAGEVEFSIDTFRIEQLLSKRMDIDYSTAGMVNTVNDMAASYDKLLNKYYNKLLKALLPEDQKVLVAAQKAWIGYRDAEDKLIVTMTRDEYSGGGTIQLNIMAGSFADLVVKRTIELFNYYNGIAKDK